MADSSLKVIRKLVDGNSRPIFIPSYDAGITKGIPAELLGFPIQINQDVAAMAANAKSVLFGDFSFYKIRDVMEMVIFRFTDSAFMKLGQIGFLMWARADGNLVDVNAVVYYQNSAS
jgi:HK97 family phage major capsid protein